MTQQADRESKKSLIGASENGTSEGEYSTFGKVKPESSDAVSNDVCDDESYSVLDRGKTKTTDRKLSEPDNLALKKRPPKERPNSKSSNDFKDESYLVEERGKTISKDLAQTGKLDKEGPDSKEYSNCNQDFTESSITGKQHGPAKQVSSNKGPTIPRIKIDSYVDTQDEEEDEDHYLVPNEWRNSGQRIE
jgi:hypothetical protein